METYEGTAIKQDYKESICPGKNNIIIGQGNVCIHDNCILIGNEIESTGDYCLVIGNSRIQVNRVMTNSEFNDLYNCLLALLRVYNQ